MTAKEEAIELVGLYYEVDGDSIYDGITWGMAKQCALICVDRIIKSQEKSNDNYGGHPLTNLEIEFYQEVKQEIKDL